MSTLMCPGPCGQKLRINRKAGERNPLCRECWNRLPRSISVELYSTWRAAYKNLPSDLLWSRYMQAKRVAIASLR